MRPVDEQWIEILRIQALCARYCLTIDTQDGEGWAGCFTEDGAFEFDGWVIRGGLHYANTQMRMPASCGAAT